MSRFYKVLLIPLFLFVFGFVGLGSVSAHESGEEHPHSEVLGEIILEPGVVSGQAFSIDVYEDSGTEMVNAVQANILYPTSLKVSSVVTTGSAFDISAEQETDNGIVKIARGTVTPVSGKQKVATVTFAGTGSASQIQVSEDSAIIRSSDSKNIYAKSQSFYPDESVMNTESAVDTSDQATDSAKSESKSGFFSKIVAWFMGLFSKDK